MEIQTLFYGFDMARMLKGLLAELLFGGIDVEIQTYVGNDYSDDAYQVDSANTAAGEKRPNALLESNREELEGNQWLSDGYIHGDINTPDGLTEILYGVNRRNLLAGNTFRIVTEERRGPGKDSIR